MISHSYRLRTNEVTKLFSHGKIVHTSLLSLKYQVVGGKTSKFAFIVSKKTAKTAVSRNALRRKGYTALRPLLKTVPAGVHGAFTIKKSGPEVTVTALATEIPILLKKVVI